MEAGGHCSQHHLSKLNSCLAPTWKGHALALLWVCLSTRWGICRAEIVCSMRAPPHPILNHAPGTGAQNSGPTLLSGFLLVHFLLTIVYTTDVSTFRPEFKWSGAIHRGYDLGVSIGASIYRHQRPPHSARRGINLRRAES